MLSWTRTDQNAQNRKAAGRHDHQRDQQEAEIHDEENVFQHKQAQPDSAKQPDTGDADISDSGSSVVPEAQVGDGVNHGQVALHTR